VSAAKLRTESDCGGMTRREVVSALARWSVPTVVTLSLAARAAAAASCPPCTKPSGGVCKACSTTKILNCQCEPCLGPPYCSGGAAAPSFSGSAARVQGGAASRDIEDVTRAALRQRAARRAESQLLSPFGRSPFGFGGDSIFGRSSRTPFGRSRSPYSPDLLGRRGSAADTRSLYERLRELDERRRR